MQLCVSKCEVSQNSCWFLKVEFRQKKFFSKILEHCKNEIRIQLVSALMEDASRFNQHLKTKLKMQTVMHFSQEAISFVLSTKLSAPVSVDH